MSDPMLAEQLRLLADLLHRAAAELDDADELRAENLRLREELAWERKATLHQRSLRLRKGTSTR